MMKSINLIWLKNKISFKKDKFNKDRKKKTWDNPYYFKKKDKSIESE
jgi:hypothetical protein